MKWLKDKWPWMTKLRHRKVLVEVMQESYEREKKSSKDWESILKLNKEYHQAQLEILWEEIESLRKVA